MADATHATAGGKGDLGSGKAQHVDLFRKLRLRRDLLADAVPGAAFVPFLGEGDIALELYADREILGIELDDAIAKATSARFVEAGLRSKVITGDANRWHPNAWGKGAPFAIADLDAFSNPYHALEALWKHGPLAERVVVFGTDGMRLAVKVSTSKYLGPLPTGKVLRADMGTRRRQFNAYWTSYVRPYLVDLVAPGQIVRELKYQRQHMLYWGIVVDRSPLAAAGGSGKPPRRPSRAAAGDASRRDPERARLLAEIAELFGLVPVQPSAAAAGDATPAEIAKVEHALLEAAESGNVPAAIFWLEHKGGERWRKAAATTAQDMLAELTGRKP